MEKQVSIAIKKIKELEFSIHSATLTNETLNVGFGVTTEFDLEKETFDIHIVYDLKDPESDATLVHIKIANTFYIEKIKEFIAPDGKSLNIPDSGLVTMLSLSISHTRAILAKNTSGTVFENYYLPIVNPVDIAKQVFKTPNK
jgi:hypothetical protein